ncbi:hypothetical protein ACTNDG_11590 [Clostridium sp. HCP1S3_B4]|uniref:hypothetical protein n=1 Tax=unclassified Clostridium TaxID=2614128 RepID=UPI003F8BDD67
MKIVYWPGSGNTEKMANYGCQIPLECKIVNEAPEDNDPSLIEYGKQIAKL